MAASRLWRQRVAALMLMFTSSSDAVRVCHLPDIDASFGEWQLPHGCVAIDLSFRAIGPEGTARLANVLARRPIRGLNLTWSAIGLEGAGALVRGIESCRSLTTLDLSGNWLADAGTLSIVTALSRFGALRHLFLRWNGISGNGAAVIAGSLAKLQRLETLDLGGNWLLDDGVAHVSTAFVRHAALEELRLDFTGAGPLSMLSIAAALRQSGTLHRLDLSGNHIDDQGIEHLTAGLRNNTSLKTLRLRLNEYVGDSGAAVLARAMHQLPQLKQLDLGGNRLSDTGVSQLLDALEQSSTLAELSLDDNSPRRSAGHAVLPGISQSLLHRLNRLQAARSTPSNTSPPEDGVVMQSRQPTASDTDEYWGLVYPVTRGRTMRYPTRPLSFFYSSAPRSLVSEGCEQHAWSKCRLDAYFEQGKTPPRITMSTSFSPFRLPPGACMRSLFEWDAVSTTAWEASYAYAKGVPDQGWVEVAHTREQTGGAWLYLATGSGIFWNCGRSLRARNKVAAAVLLLQQRHKLTRSDALRVLARGIEQGDSGMCGGQHCAAFMNIFVANRTDRNDNCYGRCRPEVPLHTWLERAAFGNGAQEWQVDHMSASSVFDHGLYRWAKQLKYDSVQLTMQPQVWCGLGWTTELLDLRVRPHRILDVLPNLGLRDPHAVETGGEPCVVRNDNISRKAFQICVYCEGTFMERNARCIADASRGRPKFTIYSQYPRHRFDACVRASR